MATIYKIAVKAIVKVGGTLHMYAQCLHCTFIEMFPNLIIGIQKKYRFLIICNIINFKDVTYKSSPSELETCTNPLAIQLGQDLVRKIIFTLD